MRFSREKVLQGGGWGQFSSKLGGCSICRKFGRGDKTMQSYGNFEGIFLIIISSNYSDLTRVFTPNGGLVMFSKGNPSISVKSRFVKCYNARTMHCLDWCHIMTRSVGWVRLDGVVGPRRGKKKTHRWAIVCEEACFFFGVSNFPGFFSLFWLYHSKSPFRTTIWENILDFFQASNKQNPSFEAYCDMGKTEICCKYLVGGFWFWAF